MCISQKKYRGGRIVLFAIGLFIPFMVQGSDLPLRDPGYERLVVELNHNNLELQAMEETVQALIEEAPFFGSLQDPVVGLGLINLPGDSFELDQEAMTQKVLFASQKFPWFGTLDKRQQLSELRALGASKKLEVRRAELISLLALEWYELGLISTNLTINEREREIVTQMLLVAESRYATGKGSQAEVLVGQVQLSELIGEQIKLESVQQSSQANIGSLLHSDESFHEVGPRGLASYVEGIDAGSLLTTVLQSNPEIHVLMVAIDSARVEVALARSAYYPNFDLRLSYGQREDNPLTGQDRAGLFSATVAMSVPLYQTSRQDRALEAAKRRLIAAQKSLSALQKRLPHTIERLLAEVRGSRKTLSLIENGLLIQQNSLADASLAAYSVGEVDFNTMLAARRALLGLERRAATAKFTIYKKLALLQKIVGSSELLEGQR